MYLSACTETYSPSVHVWMFYLTHQKSTLHQKSASQTALSIVDRVSQPSKSHAEALATYFPQPGIKRERPAAPFDPLQWGQSRKKKKQVQHRPVKKL